MQTNKKALHRAVVREVASTFKIPEQTAERHVSILDAFHPSLSAVKMHAAGRAWVAVSCYAQVPRPTTNGAEFNAIDAWNEIAANLRKQAVSVYVDFADDETVVFCPAR